MEITPIATFHSPFNDKFGIPRQSGIVSALEGTIVFEPQFRNPDSLRGLEEFDFLWLITCDFIHLIVAIFCFLRSNIINMMQFRNKTS